MKTLNYNLFKGLIVVLLIVLLTSNVYSWGEYCLPDGSVNPYFLISNSTSDVFKVDHGNNFYFYSYTSCLLETNGDGKLQCVSNSIGDDELLFNTGQHLTNSSDVVFNSVTAQFFVSDNNPDTKIDWGANSLGIMTSGSASALFDTTSITFYDELDLNSNRIYGVSTLNTGHGDNELYAMNQAVLTTSDVTFDDVTVTGNITVSDSVISTIFVLNASANMCILQNGTDILIANNLSGVNC